jgi:hypothetical protein
LLSRVFCLRLLLEQLFVVVNHVVEIMFGGGVVIVFCCNFPSRAVFYSSFQWTGGVALSGSVARCEVGNPRDLSSSCAVSCLSVQAATASLSQLSLGPALLKPLTAMPPTNFRPSTAPISQRPSTSNGVHWVKNDFERRCFVFTIRPHHVSSCHIFPSFFHFVLSSSRLFARSACVGEMSSPPFCVVRSPATHVAHLGAPGHLRHHLRRSPLDRARAEALLMKTDTD